MQAIVSGLVLAVTLTVCFFENPFSARVQNGLQRALEGHTTADGLYTEIQRFQDWITPTNEQIIAAPAVQQLPDQPPQQPTAGENELKSPVPELSFLPEP
jgi:hypothetical protein